MISLNLPYSQPQYISPSLKSLHYWPRNCSHIRGGLWQEGQVNACIVAAANVLCHIRDGGLCWATIREGPLYILYVNAFTEEYGTYTLRETTGDCCGTRLVLVKCAQEFCLFHFHPFVIVPYIHRQLENRKSVLYY